MSLIFAFAAKNMVRDSSMGGAKFVSMYPTKVFHTVASVPNAVGSNGCCTVYKPGCCSVVCGSCIHRLVLRDGY